MGTGAAAYVRIGRVGGVVVASCEPLGFAAGPAALHVNDLAVVNSKLLVALLLLTVGAEPAGRAYDLVLAHQGEIRLDVEPRSASFLDLERQDLTGLLWASSGGGALPPEMTMREPAPLRTVSEQGSERLRVAVIESRRRRTKLINHEYEYASPALASQ